MVAKPTKKRAPNLDDQVIDKIVEILDGWSSPKLTWDLFIEQIFLRVRVRYTRQALNNYSRIKYAFSTRKKFLVGASPKELKAGTPDQLRIARLESEVERLARENNALLEQFNRWVYNGYLKNMDEKMCSFMNEPLPNVQREPSAKVFGFDIGKKRK